MTIMTTTIAVAGRPTSLRKSFPFPSCFSSKNTELANPEDESNKELLNQILEEYDNDESSSPTKSNSLFPRIIYQPTNLPGKQVL